MGLVQVSPLLPEKSLLTTGLDKQNFEHKIVNIFLPISCSMFLMLKRFVSLRRFF